MAATVEPIVGRYAKVAIEGRPHRIYFRGGGAWIRWSVCTAGADGRQFPHDE
jgi:hypothetical protein